MSLFSQKRENANRELVEQILLERYNQYYRLAYRYAHNEADAFDIVQNGAYKAIRSSHTLKEPQYAQTWVYRIMLNECFQHLKRPSDSSSTVRAGGKGRRGLLRGRGSAERPGYADRKRPLRSHPEIF